MNTQLIFKQIRKRLMKDDTSGQCSSKFYVRIRLKYFNTIVWISTNQPRRSYNESKDDRNRAKECLRGNTSKCKDDAIEDRKSSSPITISMGTSYQTTATSTAPITATTILTE